MTFPGLLPRFRMVAALATLLPCVGCWEEVHYEPPPKAATAVPAGEATDPEADTSETSASTTPVVPTPSGDELFADDPPLANDPGAGTPVTADPAPIVVDPPVPVSVDDPTRPPTAAAPTLAERQAAWALASNWSLAAAMQGYGFPEMRYQDYLDAAQKGGSSLGVAVPPLPRGDDKAKLDAIVADMKTGAGPKLIDDVTARLDPPAGGAARLAIRSHLLLLTYTPAGSTVWGDAADIRDAGVASELPAELWRPVVELLERRANYDDVKKAVFDLHEAVAAHLSE